MLQMVRMHLPFNVLMRIVIHFESLSCRDLDTQAHSSMARIYLLAIDSVFSSPCPKSSFDSIWIRSPHIHYGQILINIRMILSPHEVSVGTERSLQY